MPCRLGLPPVQEHRNLAYLLRPAFRVRACDALRDFIERPETLNVRFNEAVGRQLTVFDRDCNETS